MDTPRQKIYWCWNWMVFREVMSMFYVKDCISGDVLKVYAVSEDNEGDIFFLFYESYRWIWHLSDSYEPIYNRM